MLAPATASKSACLLYSVTLGSCSLFLSCESHLVQTAMSQPLACMALKILSHRSLLGKPVMLLFLSMLLKQSTTLLLSTRISIFLLVQAKALQTRMLEKGEAFKAQKTQGKAKGPAAGKGQGKVPPKAAQAQGGRTPPRQPPAAVVDGDRAGAPAGVRAYKEANGIGQ